MQHFAASMLNLSLRHSSASYLRRAPPCVALPIRVETILCFAIASPFSPMLCPCQSSPLSAYPSLLASDPCLALPMLLASSSRRCESLRCNVLQCLFVSTPGGSSSPPFTTLPMRRRFNSILAVPCPICLFHRFAYSSLCEVIPFRSYSTPRRLCSFQSNSHSVRVRPLLAVSPRYFSTPRPLNSTLCESIPGRFISEPFRINTMLCPFTSILCNAPSALYTSFPVQIGACPSSAVQCLRRS